MHQYTINFYKNYRLANLLNSDSKSSILEDKIIQIYYYLKNHNIKDVTVGFSGGADSCLVLVILSLVRQLYEFNIHAVTILTDDSRYSSLDHSKIKKLIDNTQLFKYINFVTLKVDALNPVFNILDLSEEDMHQSYYQFMYNILFTYAQNNGGITIGTTNSDELSYVGWFGKNSDMVVDLQIISDVHKFEVIAILNHYKVAISDAPAGDIPKGMSDEEYFNTDYDTLAYYSYCKCNKFDPHFILNEVEVLHQKNRHKYFGQTFNPIFLIDKDRFLLYKDPDFDYSVK